jgi:hypothetical protein
VGYVPGRREDLRQLFEPFGSADSARTGRPASLALYVVRSLVEAHGGRTAAVRDGDGIRVRVSLRALRPRESARPAAPPGGRAADPAGGSEADAEPEPTPAARAASA